MPRRKQEREAYWRGVLASQSTGGLSVAEFCRQESIAQASFYAWRRTIRARDGSSGSVPVNGRRVLGQESRVPSFVPVRVEGAMKHEPIRIRWPGGVGIDVPALTSPRDITSVLQSVRDIAPLVDGASQ